MAVFTKASLPPSRRRRQRTAFGVDAVRADVLPDFAGLGQVVVIEDNLPTVALRQKFTANRHRPSVI